MLPKTSPRKSSLISALPNRISSRRCSRKCASRFDDESRRVHDEESWKLFRDAWLGRKSGVLTQITDNWLKPAGPALKPAVGAALNQLRAHVEPKIEALHASIDSGGDAAASPRDRVDLSLPGMIRPVGSRHLIRQVFQEIEDIFFSIGFSVAEGPGNRNALLQFRGAQHSRIPSGAR